MAERIWVEHSAGRYPVELAPDGMPELGHFVDQVAPGRRIALVTDRNVARAVPQPLKVPILVVPAGEGSKSRARWSGLTDRLLDLGFGRDTAIVALGGGVVGDLAGFVAATYLRGVPHVQVPTSLLAMVDASVGGKTAINTRHGKNLVGAFHPPAGVFVDPAATRTLRSRDLRNGLVEAIKHGLIADAAYLEWIEANRPALLARDLVALTALVRRSVEIKAAIVAADERESGRRAILNAGHTVGHAIEVVSGYRSSHGEAVAQGLVVEALLAARCDLAPAGLAEELATWFRALGVPLELPPAGEDDRLLAAMGHDKKTVGGELRFALPRAPGLLAAAREWAVTVDSAAVRQALGRARGLVAG